MLQEEGAGEGGSQLPFAPPAHSPAQSFDQDELFAAADRAGPFAAASFASQFWQDAERVVHSPAQSVDQPRSRAAIGVGYEASSSMPPRVNLPATGFGSAPDVVNFAHVVTSAFRPAANQQGDLTGARHTMPAAAPHQAAVVQQTRRRKRGREHPDEALFAAYRAEVAKTAKVSESSITGDIVALRKFSKWLDENHRTQIAGRIEDPGLDALAKNFVGNNVVLLSDTKVALARLRQHSAGQPVTAVSTVRPGTKDDEELFAQYRAIAVARLKARTLGNDLAALRKFSTWLAENHQSQIHGRIEDEQLDGLAKNFAGNDAVLLSDINVALGRLRQHSAGQTVTTAKTRPVNEENQVIEDACRAAASRYGKDTLKVYRSHLCRFNEWLSQNFGKGIAQIEPAVLSRAVDEYKKNAGPRFGTAWGFLQKYRQMVAANNALGLAAHGQAAPREQPSGPPTGTVQSTSPVAFSPIPMSPSDPAWDVLRAFHEEEAVQRGAPMATNVPQFHQTTSLPPELVPVPPPSSPAQSAGSSSTFAGLEPLSPTPYRRPDFDLNALTPGQLAEESSGSGHWTAVDGSAIAQPGSSRRSSQIYAGLDDIVDLQDDAGSAPRSDAARSRSIAGPSSSSSEPGEGSTALSAAHGRLPELGPQLGSREQADWGGRPAASQESYDQSQLWQEVDQAERQRPAGRDRPWSEWSPQSDQDMGPARRSASARSSDIYRSLDSLVDLPSTPAELRDDAHSTPFPGTASDAQVEALDPRASSHDRSGLALGATEWLNDEHIQRDYELLAQELQRENPDLAVRTRLVDPLIAHYHLR
ncbi:hypothetical protein RFM26_32735, partial [Mesorhizobium sp. VK23B]|nr:hypothetical protein [Mesorhizobium sp. VK23B]MDX8476811.1 hypothetical protein [Mesorhizobium sp. VK23A]